MGLKSLDILQFRNLRSSHLDLAADLILITGDNAAGKTSLLEAIFYLSYGRSFRSHQSKHLIQHNAEYFRLVAITDTESRLGIQKSTKEQQLRLNQESIKRLSDLSALLPVLALHPDSHQLISSGPEYRRKFIDWGVFHVEHSFMSTWKDYRSALSQRNAALRSGHNERMCSLWNQQLASNADKIEAMRLSYLELLNPITRELASHFFPGVNITVSYRRGWSKELSYMEYLTQHIQSDMEKGYTQSGPHRADLKVTLDDQPTQTSVSRGQQKLLVCLLKISQLILFSQTTQQTCVLLFDDLPAELDEHNQNLVLSILSNINVQVFVTAIDRTQINLTGWDSVKLFHVEHGVVRADEQE